MSTYPVEIDSSLNLPETVDGVSSINANTINRLRTAILAIESELGIKPSGVYTTVRARLDALLGNDGSILGPTITDARNSVGTLDNVPTVSESDLPAAVIRFTPSANTATISGFVGGSESRQLSVMAFGTSSTFAVKLVNESVSSSPQNRIVFEGSPGDIIDVPWKRGVILVYDIVIERWRVMSPPVITQDEIAPAFVVTMSGAQTVEVGQQVVTPAFIVSYVSGPADSVILTDNNGSAAKDVTSTPTSFSSNGSFTKTAISALVTFTTTATKGAVVKASSVNITWLPKVFYGVAVPGTHNEAFIEALATSALASSRNRVFSVNAGSGQHIYYAFPTSYGTPAFFVGGFEGGFNLVGSAVSVTNSHGVTISYDVWNTTHPNLGQTTVTVV